VKVPSLEFWREGKVVWNSISVPASGPLLMGLTVRQLARDRLLAFPAMPAWRKYLPRQEDHAEAPECGGILSGCFPPAPALEDRIGKYVVQHFEPSDVWLIGASEQSALDISVHTDRGYVSARRIPLPLADPNLAIHAFEYQDEVATVLLAPGRSGDAMEELQDGVLQKYRLHGLVGEDLSKLRFEPEGGPSPFKFKLPSVTHEYIEYYKSVMRKFNWEEGDQSAGRLGEVDNQGLVSNTLDDYTAGRDRCGEVVARLPEGWQYFEEVFDFEVCQLAGGEPKQLARWRAEGQVNNHCQCLGDRLMLFAGSRSGEDAFYEEMQLIDWQTQEVIRKIPLEFTPPYIESEWDRGILNGSTQTFFTHFPGVETETEGSTTFAFGTPEM